MKFNLMPLFDRVVSVVFGVMMVVIVIALIMGVLSLVLDMGHLWAEKKLRDGYHLVISDLLTLFIMIELLRSIVEYFSTKRLRMTFIVDAAIVFVLREVMIKLFEHKIQPDELYAMSALLLVLAVLRIGCVLLYQRDTQLDHEKKVKNQDD